MALPRHHQRVRAAAAAVATMLGAALLSSITQAPAIGADEFGQGVALDRHDETGKVGFIGTRPGKPIDTGSGADASAAAVARSFLAAHADSLGLRGSDLRVVEKHATPTGGGPRSASARPSRACPVLGGEFVVNLDAGNDVLSVLGEASPISAASTTPAVSSAAAAKTAVAAVAREDEGEALPASRPRRSGADALRPAAAQRSRSVPDRPAGLGDRGPGHAARSTDIGRQVVVDAASGTVALTLRRPSAPPRTGSSATPTTSRRPSTRALAPDRTEGQPAGGGDDADVQLAYDYAGDTYDFFFTRFGRDSLDGAGHAAGVDRRLLPAAATECPYENAFWDGAQMVYGDGFASADDVVGHELTHGVTELQLEPLLLPAVRRHQRVDVGRLRRVHRPDQRGRHRHRRRSGG